MVLRAGLVGLGQMGRNHARVLQTLEGVELVGVSDPLGDPSGAVGVAQVCSTVEELVEVGLDFCVVACPTEDHLKVGEILAGSGVHALIEKPLAVDAKSARQLADLFARAGLVGGVGHIERCNPAIRSMRDRLEAGELGDVFQVSTRRVGPFPARIRDVGVVKDLATHDLDLAAWVGSSNFRSISAHTIHRSEREHEDLVAAIGTLGNGVVTNHLVNWLTPFKERLVVATGDRGTFVADTLLADLTHFENAEIKASWDSISNFRGVSEGNVTRFAIPKPEPLKVELEGFRDEILGRNGYIVSMTDGVAAVSVADAVLMSASDDGQVQFLGRDD